MHVCMQACISGGLLDCANLHIAPFFFFFKNDTSDAVFVSAVAVNLTYAFKTGGRCNTLSIVSDHAADDQLCTFCMVPCVIEENVLNHILDSSPQSNTLFFHPYLFTTVYRMFPHVCCMLWYDFCVYHHVFWLNDTK